VRAAIGGRAQPLVATVFVRSDCCSATPVTQLKRIGCRSTGCTPARGLFSQAGRHAFAVAQPPHPRPPPLRHRLTARHSGFAPQQHYNFILPAIQFPYNSCITDLLYLSNSPNIVWYAAWNTHHSRTVLWQSTARLCIQSSLLP
jgi:hypothetical protein